MGQLDDDGVYKIPAEERLTRSRAYFSRRGLWLGKLATNAAINVGQVLTKERSLPKPTIRSAVRPRTSAEQKKRDAEKANVDVLKKIVGQSKEIIAQVQTVFPFTIFPDDIILDRTKITIIKRNFFWSSDVISVRIEDVLNVSCSIGPLFGSITISIRVMNSVDHFEIDRLWRRDALEVKALIQGYMIAKHSNVELTHLSVDEMVGTLRDLGYDSGTPAK